VNKLFQLQLARLNVLRKGVWFVDIPRTSSSSISSEMGKAFGAPYGKSNLIDEEYAVTQVFPVHMSSVAARDALGRFIWDRIYTFSMVRNPWDRIFSLYNYRVKVGNISKELSFRDYVLAMADEKSNNKLFKYHGFSFGSSDYLTDESGSIIVDFVARYENRAEDLKIISSRLGNIPLGSLHIQGATPLGSRYLSAYDSDTKKVIEKLFSKDIELFGYSFK